MISLLNVQNALWYASLCAEVILICQLLREKLIVKYPLFTAFLLAESLGTILLIQLGYHSRAYAKLFRTLTFIVAVLRVGVAAELYERICGHFPGIGKFRMGLAAMLTVVGAVLAFSSLRPDLAEQWHWPHTTAVLFINFQGEILACVFLLASLFFRYLLNIQQPFRSNVLNHWKISTVYFAVSGASALASLAVGGQGAAIHLINCAMLAADIGCFVAWIRLMQRSGEEFPKFDRLSPQEIEAVQRQNRHLIAAVTSLAEEVSGRLAGSRGIRLHRARPR